MVYYLRGIFTYKGEVVGKKRVDFLTDDPTGAIMVEIKAKSKFELTFNSPTLKEGLTL